MIAMIAMAEILLIYYYATKYATTLEQKVTHLFFQAQVHELELQADPCPIQAHQATVLQPKMR